MSTWIALFRGINVGGNHILPMAELREALASLGLREVRTYIQSGNVVFASPAKSAAALGDSIADCIEQQKGFRPRVLVLTPAELSAAADANPYPEAVAEPKSLHLFFLAAPAARADLAAIEALRKPSERYQLTDPVFYLHAPEGIGRSKLAAKIEQKLGVAGTGRNYRTVAKLLEMVQGA